jgi:ubiquinone/menaquinone biosynthesis C-methylase UbiE
MSPRLVKKRKVTPMSTPSHEVSTAANLANFEILSPERYFEGATQISHQKVWDLYLALLSRVVSDAKLVNPSIRVLDLGAGEGTVTEQALRLGCRVTAVDISANRLSSLSDRCQRHSDALTTVCSDVLPYLTQTPETFDIIIASAFLHHVPDYLGLIRASMRCLNPAGQWFLFHETSRYDSIGKRNRAISRAAYYSWRIRQGDLSGGIGRTLRRAFGVYRDDCPHDNVDYHERRNGMDQEAIEKLFESEGLRTDAGKYFSTQNKAWQSLGERWRVENMFWIIAARASTSRGELK